MVILSFLSINDLMNSKSAEYPSNDSSTFTAFLREIDVKTRQSLQVVFKIKPPRF